MSQIFYIKMLITKKSLYKKSVIIICMNSLRIEVLEDKTNIDYIDNYTKLFSFSYNIGQDYILKHNFNKKAGNDWISYIVWCLHAISYVDDVPENFSVVVLDNALWYENILNEYSYTQFYIKNKKPCVIIESNISQYERRKKTFSQFKI